MPVDINKINQDPFVSSDNKAIKEDTVLFNSAKLDRYNSDTIDRQWLAIWSAIVVTLWLASVIAILIKNSKCLFLSDSVLIALLGTTTLNVLGLSFIVLRGHFKSTEKD